MKKQNAKTLIKRREGKVQVRSPPLAAEKTAQVERRRRALPETAVLFHPLKLASERSFLLHVNHPSIGIALQRTMIVHGTSWRGMCTLRSNGPVPAAILKGNIELLPVLVPRAMEDALKLRASANAQRCRSCKVFADAPCIELPSEFPLVKEPACENCSLTFTLSAEHSTTSLGGGGMSTIVTTSSFVWRAPSWYEALPLEKRSPKEQEPRVFPDGYITPLAAGQFLEMTLVAVRGSLHTRNTSIFMPTASVAATALFHVEAKNVTNAEAIREACPRRVFDIEDTRLVVNRPHNCVGCTGCRLAGEAQGASMTVRPTGTHYRLRWDSISEPPGRVVQEATVALQRSLRLLRDRLHSFRQQLAAQNPLPPPSIARTL